MRTLNARSFVILTTLACLTTTGCLVLPNDPFRRNPGPRENVTIFTPIEYPRADLVRTAEGLPGPEYWQQRVDIDIDATLDADNRRITATAKIHYTNNAPVALNDMWFHLEQNLFREDSVGLSANRAAARRFGNQPTNGCEVAYVKVNDQELELNIHDTIGHVVLPEPIPADGGRQTFEIMWAFDIPDKGGRLSIEEVEAGPIFEIAQWIPQPCVYDDVHGWNTLPYLGMGEFYTNFGTFDVRITAPHDHIVAATGLLQNPEEVLTETQRDRLAQANASEETVLIITPEEVGQPDSRPEGDHDLTWHFIAHDVRTFAFASSPAFIWDAAHTPDRGTVPSEDNGDVQLPDGTLVQSFYPEEARPLWESATDMMKFSIEGYNKRWAKYPYPIASNINGATGGMEYPMIVFCRQRKEEEDLFFVTSHEIGHNWFPMMVNSDERRYPWMDEGFNMFINIYSFRERHPESEWMDNRLNRTIDALKTIVHQPLMTHADHTAPYLLGILHYNKAAMGMYALRETVLGHDRFDHAFRKYIAEWSFKSPKPFDFFRCMENAAGADLSWLWRGWWYETDLLDQSVVSVTQGWGREEFTVVFRNHGEVVMPADYKVRYQDGTEEMRRIPVAAWYQRDQYTDSWKTNNRRIKSIDIDPNNTLLDINRRNNHWPRLW